MRRGDSAIIKRPFLGVRQSMYTFQSWNWPVLSYTTVGSRQVLSTLLYRMPSLTSRTWFVYTLRSRNKRMLWNSRGSLVINKVWIYSLGLSNSFVLTESSNHVRKLTHRLRAAKLKMSRSRLILESRLLVAGVRFNLWFQLWVSAWWRYSCLIGALNYSESKWSRPDHLS
jgi:hypothetical protein